MALPIHSWQGPGISWKSDATRFVIADESGYKTHCSPRMCLLFTVTFDTKLHWLFFPEWLFKWCLFIKIWDFLLLGTFGEVFVCVRELRQLWQNWQLPFKCQMSLPNCNLHLKQKKTIQDTDIPCRHLCYSCGPPRAVVVFFFFFWHLRSHDQSPNTSPCIWISNQLCSPACARNIFPSPLQDAFQLETAA